MTWNSMRFSMTMRCKKKRNLASEAAQMASEVANAVAQVASEAGRASEGAQVASEAAKASAVNFRIYSMESCWSEIANYTNNIKYVVIKKSC